MGHDPRKLGKLSVSSYSDIQLDILLVNLIEERLEIDLGSAVKKNQAGLLLILGLQQIFHPYVLCSNLTRDAEHCWLQDQCEDADRVGRDFNMKLVVLTRWVLFNGKEDPFVVEISGSIEVRSKFRSNARLLEFADVPVLFSKGNNESFLPEPYLTLQAYCGTRLTYPFLCCMVLIAACTWSW